MTLLLIIIIAALVFDFLNGFHDAANSIATVVSTRVLKPHWAVLWAAFFNFIAFLFFKLKVASTIGTGLINVGDINLHLILAALIGAIIWNIITWYLALPTSSSHALIGGLIGAAVSKAGWSSLNILGISKVIVSIFISPSLGFIFGGLLLFIVIRIFYHKTPLQIDRWFRKMQLISSAFISLSHGGNDAQKTMGIIAIALFSSGKIGPHFHVPLWVIVTCNFVIALGTMFGGWRIVKTMGMHITKLRPVDGFCAETASAITLSIATSMGIPVSTTHTIAGSIMGVGSFYSLNAVRWGIAQRIVWAWIITIPASAIVAAATWWIMKLF